MIHDLANYRWDHGDSWEERGDLFEMEGRAHIAFGNYVAWRMLWQGLWPPQVGRPQ